MNIQAYVRTAVELANEWAMFADDIDSPYCLWKSDPHAQECIDALAAQLVRQVDAIQYDDGFDPYSVLIFKLVSEVREIIDQCDHVVAKSEGDDRTMNTIKAIVDSGVLSTGDPNP